MRALKFLLILPLLVPAMVPLLLSAVEEEPVDIPAVKLPPKPVELLNSGEKIVWMDDFEAAKKLAKEQHKNLLLDFTGSDWCGWCIKLKGEVFDKPEFKVAADEFIFVELDYPHEKKLSPAIKTQNDELQQRFAIEGFPTIFLTDADGKPYGKTGYQAGGPKAYLAHLASFKPKLAERDELLGKIEKANGVAKAKLMDQLLESLGDAAVPGVYGDLPQQIIALDADGKAGLKAKYETVAIAQQAGEIQTMIQSGQLEAADTSISALLANPATPKEVQCQVHFFRAILVLQKQDFAGAIASLDAGLKADPTNEHAEILRGLRKQLQAKIDADAGKNTAP